MGKKVQKTSPNKKPSPEELGNMLINIYESGYLDKTKTYKMSFIKGVMSGLGGVIGATVVLVLLLWMLSLFQNVPLVGKFVRNFKETVNTQQR